VAFHVVETMFSLAPVGEALRPLGVPLDLFFTRPLRDGFALAAAGSFRPFPDLARATLTSLSTSAGETDIDDVLQAFGELPDHPDVRPALELLAQSGVTAVALTNGSTAPTVGLLERAGLTHLIGAVVSVDEVRLWKPSPSPYHHLVYVTGRRASEVAMVAVHSWDLHGARAAGLVTGWCARHEGRPSPIFDAADVSGADLVAVVEALLALPP
jgi:2-haloacid dehalogenase